MRIRILAAFGSGPSAALRGLCVLAVVSLVAAGLDAGPSLAASASQGTTTRDPASATAATQDENNASIWPAVVSGVAAIVVAVVGAFLSYLFGRRTMREELRNQLEVVKAEGLQSRETAQRQYQLEAMKVFREAVGPPKSQIIEAAHDLSDRLRRFLSDRRTWEWTRGRGYFRHSFTWLIARPFVWSEIMRREMIYLDQTLGDLIEDDLRFLAHCRLLDRALTEADLFAGTSYNTGHATAHVFAGSLRELTEQCVLDASQGNISKLRCIDFRVFDGFFGETNDDTRALTPAEQIEILVSDLAEPANPDAPFRIARLIALYCATNCLLEGFSLPFRPFETAHDSAKWTRLLPDEIRPAIDTNLATLLASAPASTAPGSIGGVTE